MRLAEKFSLPVITFIDTPGAFPGIESEERNIAEAIAFNLREMMRLKSPLLAVILGEGGSGGALGIGVADRVLMLEHAYYSVISPEGLCRHPLETSPARPGSRRSDEAHSPPISNAWAWSMKSSRNRSAVPTRSHAEAASQVQKTVLRHLRHLKKLLPESLLTASDEKFRKFGESARKARLLSAERAPGGTGSPLPVGGGPARVMHSRPGTTPEVAPLRRASSLRRSLVTRLPLEAISADAHGYPRPACAGAPAPPNARPRPVT